MSKCFNSTSYAVTTVNVGHTQLNKESKIYLGNALVQDKSWTSFLQYLHQITVTLNMTIAKKLITRYNELKQEAPDCLLLMQVGAFMKVMNDDAKTISEITGLQLQMAGTVEEPVVTGGFPVSGLDKYIGRIVRQGYSVAIAMQDDSKERHINEIIKIQLIIN